MKRHPSDFSFEDLLKRVCTACGITAAQLANPEDFPGVDYHDEAGTAFWCAETVRMWVQARAWAEILSRPHEVKELADILLAFRKLYGQEPLSHAAAKAQALHHFVNARVDRVMGRDDDASRAAGGEGAP